MADPNLLVTSDPEQSEKAQSSIKGILKKAGVDDAEFQDSHIAGVSLLRVPSDPTALVQELRDKCREDPSAFSGTFRWIPIETNEAATDEAIERVAKDMNQRISDDEAWAINVKTHHTDLHKQDVTELAAKHIDHPNVDLDNPDKEIRFEIIEDRMAVSLLKPSQILNVNEFRSSSPVEPRD